MAKNDGFFAVIVLAFLCLSIAHSARAEVSKFSPTQGLESADLHQADGYLLPEDGPNALPDRTVVFLGEDIRNGGILGVAFGVREAVSAIGWRVHILDIHGKDENRQRMFRQVLELRPDGLILGGVDAVKNDKYLQIIDAAGIPIVGWHTAPLPGPVDNTPVRWNVATDSIAVAKTAAEFVVVDSKGRAGVVIFTDSRFAIAEKKVSIMAEIIDSCSDCTLLDIVDVPLKSVAEEMPDQVDRLVKKFGPRWQYTLAINDLYFDYAVATLVMRGYPPQGPPMNISVGDGSASAFLRIRENSYQHATVPEPLLFHGWQLIDELNRILQGVSTSGVVTPTTLITAENIDSENSLIDLFDPKNGYRQRYLSIWERGSVQ